MIVEAHAHFVLATLLEELKHTRRLFPSIATTRDGASVNPAFSGGAPAWPVLPKLVNLRRRDWLAA